MTDNNLLAVLSKWAYRQDENFLSEAFAHLVRHLAAHEPDVAARLLRRLTDGALDLSAAQLAELQVATQVIIPGGRPDIELRTRTHLAYIEVKVGATLGVGQLKLYAAALEQSKKQSGFAQTCLVFLTQYPETPPEGEEPDVQIRWYHIAEWLEVELEDKITRSTISRYLVEQFLVYLKGRSMTLEHVGSELVSGVQSLLSLRVMMGEALASQKAHFKSYASYTNWADIGYNVDKSKFYFFVWFDQPEIVRFWTYNFKFDEQKCTQLGFGKVFEKDGMQRWANELDLAAESVDFFVLTKANQQEAIEKFLKESLDALERIAL